MPTCGRCGGELEHGDAYAVVVFGKPVHKDCFNCVSCGQRLFSFGKFYDDGNGNPLCAGCRRKTVPPCDRCKQPLDGEYRVAQGNWHPKCHYCDGCKKLFDKDEKNFFRDENKLWHLECFAKTEEGKQS